MIKTRPVAMVTGASSGIGIDFARQLAQRGFDLVLTARRVERLEQVQRDVAQEHGCEVHIVPADLGTPEGIAELLTTLKRQDWRLTVLINNAGLGAFGSFEKQPPSDIDAMIGVNVSALTLLTQAFANELRTEASPCYLLNVASYSAFSPPSDYAVYAASKSYVLGLTQAIAGPYKRAGIQVSALCPGFFRSEFFEQSGHRPSPITQWLMSDSERVATIGLKGMFRGQTIVVPGWLYRTSLATSRLLPRTWSTRIANWVMQH